MTCNSAQKLDFGTITTINSSSSNKKFSNLKDRLAAVNAAGSTTANCSSTQFKKGKLKSLVQSIASKNGSYNYSTVTSTINKSKVSLASISSKDSKKNKY